MIHRVQLGVIGCGEIGRRHLEAAHRSSRATVVAVADRSESAAREAAARFAVPGVYSDGDALLLDPMVEAVVLALPTQGRSALAVRALAHGKHVLIEKPAALHAAEIKAMLAARGTLIAACCSARFRFLPSAQIVTNVVASGRLGDLRIVRYRAIKAVTEPPQHMPPAWRLSHTLNGGGIMANFGSYDLDYLLGVTGWVLCPRSVLAQTWTIAPQLASYVGPGSDAETHGTALVRCDSGVALMIERGEYVAAQPEDAWQIVGTHGALRFKMMPERNKTIVYDQASASQGVVSSTIWQGDEDYDVVHAGPMLDFVDAICEQRQPKTNLEQALVVQTIIDAIYASAEQGTAVTLAHEASA